LPAVERAESHQRALGEPLATIGADSMIGSRLTHCVCDRRWLGADAMFNHLGHEMSQPSQHPCGSTRRESEAPSRYPIGPALATVFSHRTLSPRSIIHNMWGRSGAKCSRACVSASGFPCCGGAREGAAPGASGGARRGWLGRAATRPRRSRGRCDAPGRSLGQALTGSMTDRRGRLSSPPGRPSPLRRRAGDRHLARVRDRERRSAVAWTRIRRS